MEAQASRTARLTITATEQEQRAAQAVALIRGTDVSNLLRSRSLADVLVEYERLAESLQTSNAA